MDRSASFYIILNILCTNLLIIHIQIVYSCKCVSPNLCADDDANVNGQGFLDIRIDNYECPNYFDVCCDNLKEDVNLSKNPTKLLYKGCGLSNSLGVGTRITTDSKATLFGELPWSLIILVKDLADSNKSRYKCGGSLIHPQVVLTAAHCIAGLDGVEIRARAGEWNTKVVDEPLPHQEATVVDVEIHPHFQPGSLRNDIALLFLEEPFHLTDNVGIICLPPPGFKVDSARCTASGWGKDAFKHGKHSSIQKKVDLPIVPRRQCLSALRSTRLGRLFNLHRSFICAGGEENKDTCKGDGGSPLVCPIDGQPGRFFQLGIVSWGIGCGESTPGVYVNVPLYSDWIERQLISKHFDSNMFKF